MPFLEKIQKLMVSVGSSCPSSPFTSSNYCHAIFWSSFFKWFILDILDTREILNWMSSRGSTCHWIPQTPDEKQICNKHWDTICYWTAETKLHCNKQRGPAHSFCIYRFYRVCVHSSLLLKWSLNGSTQKFKKLKICCNDYWL